MLLYQLLHEIQAGTRLDAFSGGLFVNCSVKICRQFFQDNLLDRLSRIVRFLCMIDQRVKCVDVLLRDFI